MVPQSCDPGSMLGVPILKCLSFSLLAFKIEEHIVFFVVIYIKEKQVSSTRS